MTRSFLVELIVVVLALVLGYGGVSFAERREPTPTPSLPSPVEPPTATVAPAVTFTPAPTLIAQLATPTPSPTEPLATETPTASATASLPTRTPTATPTPIFYVVQAGDSLDGIARRFNVTADAISRANHLSDPNSLAEGQKLLIPPK